MKTSAWALFCIISILTIGCSSFIAGKKPEPATIMIRNSSSTYVEEVSIRGIKKQYNRIGSISPLPVNVTQVIGRPSNPPRLPDTILVCWGAKADKPFCKQVSLRTVLKDYTGSGEAMVIDIKSMSEVGVYLENFP